MIESIQKFFKGYVRIQVTSESSDRFINLCAGRGMFLWDLTSRENCLEMNLSISDFRKIRPLAKKCGAHISIRTKKGLPFLLYANRHRKSLAAGLVFGLGLMFLLSVFVWNIEINGNRTETTEVIFEYLKEQEIYFGARKSSINCKELAADLRRTFSDFTWVSAKIKGTSLLIEVKENDMETAEEVKELPVSDLVADCSGIIETIVTRKGVPQVKAGDKVKKGDLLVSGEVPVYNDAKEVVGYQYCGADADIQIKTVYTYKDSFSLEYEEKVYTGMERKGVQLRFGKKSWVFDPGSGSYEAYDRITKEWQLGFSRYFKLPVYIGSIQVREYRTEMKIYEENEAKALMQQNFLKNLEKIQEKGLQIFENNVKIETDERSCTARGTLVLIHETGKRVERTTLDQ